MTRRHRQPELSTTGVKVRVAVWIALGLYYATASVAGPSYWGFVALLCGWFAGRQSERPR